MSWLPHMRIPPGTQAKKAINTDRPCSCLLKSSFKSSYTQNTYSKLTILPQTPPQCSALPSSATLASSAPTRASRSLPPRLSRMLPRPSTEPSPMPPSRVSRRVVRLYFLLSLSLPLTNTFRRASRRIHQVRRKREHRRGQGLCQPDGRSSTRQGQRARRPSQGCRQRDVQLITNIRPGPGQGFRTHGRGQGQSL